MSARGSYRAIHTVLVDGPDYQGLSPNAKLVMLTLKLSLGPTGIDVCYTTVLEARTGLTAAQVETALAALVRAGWLQRERNVMWLVDALAFEPSRSLTNANHLQEIGKHADSLPRLAIVDAFRTHYKLPGAKAATHPKGMGDTIPDGMGDRLGEHGRTEEGKNGERDNGDDGAAGATPSDHPDLPAEFLACWDAYPKRPNDSRKKALKAWQARVRAGVGPETLLAGTRRYAAYCDATGRTGTEYVQQAATFYGPDEHYLTAWEVTATDRALRPGSASGAGDPTQKLLDALEGAGLTHEGLGREEYKRRVDELAPVLGYEPGDFRALVSRVKPWDLQTRFTFVPERRREFERRLAASRNGTTGAAA